jgi:hypothetical protein
MLAGCIRRPQQGQQRDGYRHHAKHIDVELGVDIFHFLEFDRTWRDHDAGVVYQAIQNATSGYFPDTIRQFSNMLLPCNIADHRMNITITFSLHPLGIVFRTYRCDNAVTALRKSTGSTKAKASAGARDKDRFRHSNLTQRDSGRRPPDSAGIRGILLPLGRHAPTGSLRGTPRLEAFTRDPPDDPRSGVNDGTFSASRQGRRKVQTATEIIAGELRALVGVEDLRFAVAGNGLLDGLETEIRRHRIRHSPRQHPPRGPMHDRCQVNEAALHRQTRDVLRPDVIRSLDGEVA